MSRPCARALRAIVLFAAGLLASAPALAEECLATTRVGDLERPLADAEAAFGGADATTFQDALDEVALVLPCLGERLPAPTAARLHRLTGIRAYVGGDPAAERDALYAARVLEPAYRFPEALLAAGHDVRRTYDGIDPTGARARTVPEPRGGSIAFDGTVTRKRPADRSTLVQLSVGDQVLTTRYLRPADPLPAYRAVPRTRNALIAAAASSLALSAGAYAAAFVVRDRFDADDPSYTSDDLRAMQGQTTVLVGLSATFGALALGGGAGAVLVGER